MTTNHLPSGRSRLIKLGAAAAILTMIAAACGSSGKSNTTPTTAPSSPGGGTTTTTSLVPKPGGDLTMAVEAEVDGFDPTQNRFDITGHLYATTIYDPLTQIGKDGKAHPYLAKSLTPDSTYKTWTITMRSGIKFSNGDPLTGAVVAHDLKAQTQSILTGSALANVADVVAGPGPLDVTVTCKTPWTVFPLYMSGQLGYIYDPASTDTVKKPIGTGPFMMKEWFPNDHFTAVKNPNYWQPGLPYLNSVTFKPILDQTARENSLLSGTVDMLHTDYAPTIVDLRKKKGTVNVLDTSQFSARTEMDFYMINELKAPFDDVNLRKALAMATNQQSLIDTFGAGILKQSNGPYTHGTPWYVDSGYPKYDPAGAKALVDTWKAAHGGQAPTFTLQVTNTAISLQTAQFVQDMWQQVGFKVSITQTAQSQYILVAIQGNYQVIGWRQFGEVDPDADFVWWGSVDSAPIGKFALNFARNTDPQIDADLTTGRSSTDEAARVAAYQDISRQFAKDIPYIWTDESLWAIASKPKVQGIQEWMMPDGSAGADNLTVGGLGGGTIFLHVWLNG